MSNDLIRLANESGFPLQIAIGNLVRATPDLGWPVYRSCRGESEMTARCQLLWLGILWYQAGISPKRMGAGT